MGQLGDLLTRLDEERVRRGRQFERICKWFLANDPLYRRQVERVWLWDEWPGRWGADAGIDLVVEDREGGLWAVQAKAYDPAYSVTKGDVDTFLSESSRPEFSYRLLIATTNKVGKTARRTLAAQEKQAGLLLLADLEAAQADWPSSPAALRPQTLKRKRPRPHQAKALRAVVKGFEHGDRGQLIMACGTGKTLTALFIAENLNAKRTLVLVPSLSLLAQTLREWTANASEDFDCLTVCSDDTVIDPDAAVNSTSDLGFPVTTDPEDIARFLRRRSGRQVVFSTYQSSPRIARAYAAGRMPRLDLAIADEAHRCAGRVSGDFATILDAGAIPAERRLFMTATPRFFTDRLVREAKEDDFEVASMDDEATFGPVFHKLTFGEAISKDLLSDYQVAVIGVDDATYRRWAERGRFVTLDGKAVTDARSLAGQIGVAKAIGRYGLRRTISFHSRVARARAFAQSLPEVVEWMPKRQRPKGSLWAEHVSGQMSTGQRAVSLERLRHLDDHGAGLLANARCLSEGVDVPTLDGVAFIDPRRSEVDIIQAVGRAIRKAEDKTKGTIVIPVFMGFEEDPDAALDDSAFKPVWDVVRALRAHDTDLAEQLDTLRRELGKGGSRVTLPQKIHLDLPSRIGLDFAEAFDVKLVESTTAAWEYSYGRLLAFIEREGHSRVPSEYRDDDGYRLGRWVAHQRQDGKAGKLTHARSKRLSDLPEWIWDTQNADWENGYVRLLSFVRREGNPRVPRNYRDADGYQLGYWVGNQRQFGGQNQLSRGRLERLNAVPGWEWALRRVSTPDWEDGYARLARFAAREGHTDVPSAYRDTDGYRLGRWVSHQKQVAKSGKLSDDRERHLRSLPGWNVSAKEAAWERAYADLVRFVEREGHARVPPGHEGDHGLRLGAWVSKARAARSKGRLSGERAARLERLPGWVWAARGVAKAGRNEAGDGRNEAQWRAVYAELERFVERQGHARVPAGYAVNGFKLGSWVARQRRVRNKGELVQERAQLLEDLPGWVWRANTSDWDDGYAHLVRFVEREGHSRVPWNFTDSDAYRLGAWVHLQRQSRKRAELLSEREQRLEDLPGWIWTPRDHHWDDGYQRLVRFVERNGHARVPAKYRDDDEYPLGHWVVAQRHTSRAGKLDPRRSDRLTRVPGWLWDAR